MNAAIPLTANATVPGPEPTRPARLEALGALGAAGWPNRRREHWRYTDLEPLAAAGFELAAAAPSVGVREAVQRLLQEPALGAPSRQLVWLDGERTAGIGADAIHGVELVGLEERWSEFVRQFAKPLAAGEFPLAALNTAFSRGGLWLKVPAGEVVAEPIHVVIVGSASQVASQPRIVVDVESGARVTLIQHFVDIDPNFRGWVNGVTQVRQAAGSKLELYRIQRHALGAAHTSLLAAELDAGAELTTGYFDVGGRLVRNDIAIGLNGRDARVDLFGLLLAGAGQHVDDHTVIRHAAGATVSAENVRAIIGERGRGVFNGKVVVEPGCQRIDAQQRNDNLLLGDHAEIDAKPELEIYANDVKCSHGSTVGEIDAEQLFYLRTRGLPLVEARRMLTTAFAATVVEQIAAERIRDLVLERVTAKLEQLTEQ